MPDIHAPEQNRLLAALPADERAHLAPHLELVALPLGQALCEPGARMSHVYFPTTAIVSLLYVMEDGASAEIAVVGNEGVVGVSLFMGGETTTSRAVVQSAGHGYRMAALRRDAPVTPFEASPGPPDTPPRHVGKRRRPTRKDLARDELGLA